VIVAFPSVATRVTLALLASYGVVRLLRSRSAALRHTVWSAAFAASLLRGVAA